MVNKNEFISFAESARDAFLKWERYLQSIGRPEPIVSDAMDKAIEADSYAEQARKLSNSQFKAWYKATWGNWNVTAEPVPLPPAINQMSLFAA